MLKSQFNIFDPPIKVVPLKGKSFDLTTEQLSKIQAIEGVVEVVHVIEDYAYVKYRDRDMVVTIKGVSENFLNTNQLSEAYVYGPRLLNKDSIPFALVGRGVQNILSIIPGNELYPIQVHYIKDIKPGRMRADQLYSKKNILAGAVFAVEKNIDENYIIVPIGFIRELFNYNNRLTALEISLEESADLTLVQQSLNAILGTSFSVLNDEEQHESIYSLIKLEKLFAFLVFSLLLGIGSINIFFTLSMLAIEKKKDISVLFAMGATNHMIKNIFLKEGALIAFSGAFIGVVSGLLFYFLQIKFGILSFGIESTIVSAYPVELRFTDIFYTAMSILAITFIASIRPALIARRYNSLDGSK